MNLPNQLTVSRFVFAILFMVAMYWRSPLNDTIALVLFCLGGLTDFLDGKLARKYNLQSDFGKLMDPLADKVLICSAFISLIERTQANPVGGVQVYAWMVAVIVTRELAITGLRLVAAAKNQVLAAEKYGKHKTISQITAIIAMLVLQCYDAWWPWLQAVFKPWAAPFTHLALWASVTLTLTSGVLYLWRNRGLYMKEL